MVTGNACSSLFEPCKPFFYINSFFPFFKKTCSIRCLSSLPDIKSSDIKLTKSTKPKPKPTNIGAIEFGREFTDHMLSVRWTEKGGWEAPEIKPYGNLSIDPAAKVLHYAVEGFEGMKAYRAVDGSIRLFRPMENIKRLQRTSERLCLPGFNGEEFLKCLMELIKVEKDWVPADENCSLYIRPVVMGTTPTLGVNLSDESLLYCILSPVGPYFKTGSFQPVTLMANPKFVRSWHGGTGDSKAGGNYAPTLLAQADAAKKNCEQVLWLYGEEQQLTEVGTMNLFIFWENENGEKELLTPPLDGIILPGITRMSLLDIAREWNDFKVTEKRFTMNDLKKGLKEKRIKEVFGAGTACVICPIKSILFNNETIDVPTMDHGPDIAKRLYEELTGIQYGRIPSPWSVSVTN